MKSIVLYVLWFVGIVQVAVAGFTTRILNMAGTTMQVRCRQNGIYLFPYNSICKIFIYNFVVSLLDVVNDLCFCDVIGLFVFLIFMLHVCFKTFKV